MRGPAAQMPLARTISGIWSEKNSSVRPPVSSRQLASAQSSAGQLLSMNSWRNSMANIAPFPFVVVPAVVIPENEEAAGISRRPLSPAAELVGGLPSRPVLRAQWPHVGVGGGHGKERVQALGCLDRHGGRGDAGHSRRGGAPARNELAVEVARHNGTPFRVEGPTDAGYQGHSLPAPIPPRDGDGVKRF